MNDLVLTPSSLPAYLVNQQVADNALAAAMAGLNVGFPPSIRIKGGKFQLVDSDGNQTVVRPGDMVDGEFLPVVILGFKEAFDKVYYADAYDPNQSEAKAPDCFSLDGQKPDASVKTPQHSNCASCPMNAFGSGRNQAGQPTKGKACSDNKILAVMYKGGIYRFKIPPASLRNFAGFVKDFRVRSEGKIPPHFVMTYIGFDDKSDFSVLTFQVGGFVPETALDKICRMVESQEVKDIVHPSYTPSRIDTPQAATPAPVKAPVQEAPAQPAPIADMFGGGQTQEQTQAEAPAPKRGRPKASAPVQEVEVVDPTVLSDDDIASKLGL